MKGKVVPFDSESHLAAQLLLPWYVVGRLDAAERARVEAHLVAARAARPMWRGSASCATAGSRPRCPAPPNAGSPPCATASRTANLRRRRAPEAARTAARRRPVRWPRWALALQFAALLGFALLLFVPRPDEPAYHALGAAPPNANLVVVFRPSATEQQIRDALRASDARLVGGPTTTDAYLLEHCAGATCRGTRAAAP